MSIFKIFKKKPVETKPESVYAEKLANLIQQNQYIIQEMLSNDMDKTELYWDLVKATDDAYNELADLGYYQEFLQRKGA